jgi:hypothetical protein
MKNYASWGGLMTKYKTLFFFVLFLLMCQESQANDEIRNVLYQGCMQKQNSAQTRTLLNDDGLKEFCACTAEKVEATLFNSAEFTSLYNRKDGPGVLQYMQSPKSMEEAGVITNQCISKIGRQNLINTKAKKLSNDVIDDESYRSILVTFKPNCTSILDREKIALNLTAETKSKICECASYKTFKNATYSEIQSLATIPIEKRSGKFSIDRIKSNMKKCEKALVN